MLEDLGAVLDVVKEHAPFIGVAFLLAYVGNFFGLRVFTRERAYDMKKNAALRAFFWVGREFMPVHPVIAGALIGLVWRAPYGTVLPLAESSTYFAVAGALGTVGWLTLKAYAKRRGIPIMLPWRESLPAGITADDIVDDYDNEPTLVRKRQTTSVPPPVSSIRPTKLNNPE